MMDSVDIQAIKDQLSTIVSDQSVSVVIKRGGVSLLAQSIRLVKPGNRRVNERVSVAGKQVVADILVLGSADLDIDRGDRFAVAGVAYEIIFVDDNSTVKKTAEAIILV